MKKHLTALSLAANIGLLAGLLWSRAETREIGMVAMRGDEAHLRIHAASLAAIETPESERAAMTTELLRKLIAAGEENIKARRQLGLGG